jgi:cytochrome oxidase assembly protein ShyY1
MLLRPRWVAGHLLVLALTASFIALGFWQLGRDHHKQQLVREARAAFAAPAPDVASRAAPAAGARAEATGVYDSAHDVLWTDQVHNGKDGDDILTPLRLTDGTAVLVDRGWVAVVGGGAPIDTSAATGPVVVNGIVNPSSPLSAQDAVTTVAGRLALPRVDLTRIGRDLGYTLRPIWLLAQAQTPAPARDAPALPQPPPPDQVNHMEYTIEWFSFALIGIIGWPVALLSISRRRGGFSTPT